MYAYSNLEYEYQIEEEMIEWEMHNFKVQAMQALNSMIAHPKFSHSEEFIRILSYGYFDNHPDAEKITKILNFSKLHFFAVLDDIECFKEEYFKDKNIGE